MYKHTIDLDYVDHKHGHPLTSLAILAGQAMVAIQLLERGASPFKRNNSGRTVLYIATESGVASVVRHIIKMHPELDLNQPVTSEIQRYCCIHVSVTSSLTSSYLQPLTCSPRLLLDIITATLLEDWQN